MKKNSTILDINQTTVTTRFDDINENTLPEIFTPGYRLGEGREAPITPTGGGSSVQQNFSNEFYEEIIQIPFDQLRDSFIIEDVDRIPEILRNFFHNNNDGINMFRYINADINSFNDQLIQLLNNSYTVLNNPTLNNIFENFTYDINHSIYTILGLNESTSYSMSFILNNIINPNVVWDALFTSLNLPTTTSLIFYLLILLAKNDVVMFSEFVNNFIPLQNLNFDSYDSFYRIHHMDYSSGLFELARIIYPSVMSEMQLTGNTMFAHYKIFYHSIYYLNTIFSELHNNPTILENFLQNINNATEILSTNYNNIIIRIPRPITAIDITPSDFLNNLRAIENSFVLSRQNIFELANPLTELSRLNTNTRNIVNNFSNIHTSLINLNLEPTYTNISNSLLQNNINIDTLLNENTYLRYKIDETIEYFRHQNKIINIMTALSIITAGAHFMNSSTLSILKSIFYRTSISSYNSNLGINEIIEISTNTNINYINTETINNAIYNLKFLVETFFGYF